MFFSGAISADSHVLEPPDCYSRFIDPRFRHLAPQLLRRPSGAEAYVIPGMQRTVSIGHLDAAGMTVAERRHHIATTRFEETRRSAWDASSVTSPEKTKMLSSALKEYQRAKTRLVQKLLVTTEGEAADETERLTVEAAKALCAARSKVLEARVGLSLKVLEARVGLSLTTEE